jgi:hypothetical protein
MYSVPRSSDWSYIVAKFCLPIISVPPYKYYHSLRNTQEFRFSALVSCIFTVVHYEKKIGILGYIETKSEYCYANSLKLPMKETFGCLKSGIKYLSKNLFSKYVTSIFHLSCKVSIILISWRKI